MTKVYIDGSEGTTGLRINERFKGRDDIEILTIPSELRKDVNERRKYINESDITFCVSLMRLQLKPFPLWKMKMLQ